MGFAYAFSLLNVITTPEVSGLHVFCHSNYFFVICAHMTGICILYVSSYVFCECKDILIAEEKYNPSFPEKLTLVLTVYMCWTNNLSKEDIQ